MFKQIITSRRMHGLFTTNVVLDSLSTVLHTRLNWICSLLKYAFPVASNISRSQTHQRMDFAMPLDRVGMRLLLMESLSTLVYRHSFSAPTPTINTLQQIELTITKAFAIHIRYAQRRFLDHSVITLALDTTVPFYWSIDRNLNLNIYVNLHMHTTSLCIMCLPICKNFSLNSQYAYGDSPYANGDQFLMLWL
jgi:hypothetical protein